MNTITFRTECEYDIKYALKILNVMDIEEVSEPKDWSITIKTKMNLYRFTQQFKTLIESSGIQDYEDLHRCHETAAVGTEPNEEWYKYHGTAKIY